MRLVELRTVRTPLQPNVCLVELVTDDGVTGVGEAFWGAGAVEAYLHEGVWPVLAGLPDVRPVAVANALRPYVGFSGSGAELRGNGAVDMALWDLLGKASGQPVVRLLGGPMAPELRVYNTCAGYDYIKHASRQESSNWGLPTEAADRPYEDLSGFLERPAELTRSLLEEGYTAMKVWPFDRAAEASRGHRIDTPSLREAMTVLEAIRAEGGDRMDVMVELHSLWSLKAATQILHALEDLAPYWVEDPIRTDAVEAYRRLRERVRVPVAAGEAMSGTRGFKPLLDAGALDVAIVDIGWTGGITEAVRIASMADTYGVSFAPHDCTGPVSFAVSVHVAAAQPNCVLAENVRAFQHSWYPVIAEGLPIVENGIVQIPTAPGLGVRLRKEFLADPTTRIRAS
jgi:L-alanine-DL-glutamate epimerase-like enolase superfamily enzyme